MRIRRKNSQLDKAMTGGKSLFGVPPYGPPAEAAHAERPAGIGPTDATAPIGMETALYPAEVVTSWRIVGVALIGALLSCVWFGWYLAVSLPVLGDSRGLARAQAAR